MSKLLAQYSANPSAKLAAKIRAYDQKHPMASCMLSAEEHVTLRAAMAAD